MYRNLFLALSISAVAVAYSFTIDFSPKEEIIFVKNTDDSKTIVEELRDRGFIKNKLTYYVVLALSNFMEKPEPGGYVMSRGLNALALHTAISDPDYKYVVIEPGLRKEQITERFSKKLGWDEKQTEDILKKNRLCEYYGREGYLAPGEYLVSKDADIQTVQRMLEDEFYKKFSEKVKTNKDGIFDEDQVIKIASLIQREAAGKSDSRLISGIIWNRILSDMPLQLDATLQYVKGNEDRWWPQVYSEDKYLDSPYNTYQTKGLPPTPIANPSDYAIDAAMNPLKTSCMYYLHDKNRNIHCATNYKEHLSNIKRYL